MAHIVISNEEDGVQILLFPTVGKPVGIAFFSGVFAGDGLEPRIVIDLHEQSC